MKLLTPKQKKTYWKTAAFRRLCVETIVIGFGAIAALIGSRLQAAVC